MYTNPAPVGVSAESLMALWDQADSSQSGQIDNTDLSDSSGSGIDISTLFDHSD